jgi:curved DNA-binding protein CbpA
MAAAARNLYDVLGVPATADRGQIRTAFRRLAREHHPDVSAHPEAGARFREVVEAYRTLSRPTARRLYDLFGRHGLSADAIEELARWLAVGRRRAEPAVVAEVVLGFSEAARGGTFGVEVETTWTCASCAGGGAEPGSATERAEAAAGAAACGARRSSATDGCSRSRAAPSARGPEADRSGLARSAAVRAACAAPPRRGADPGGDDRRRHLAGRAGRPRSNGGRGVRPLPDAPMIRYAALTLLALALAFLGFLLSL